MLYGVQPDLPPLIRGFEAPPANMESHGPKWVEREPVHVPVVRFDRLFGLIANEELELHNPTTHLECHGCVLLVFEHHAVGVADEPHMILVCGSFHEPHRVRAVELPVRVSRFSLCCLKG